MTQPVPREISIGPWSELHKSERLIFEADGIEIGLFFLGDQMRAWLNRCPHLGGPACQGKMMPRTLETTLPDGRGTGLGLSATQRHIVCPWHGYEFDMLTGEHPFDPKMRLWPVPVRVVDGTVVVTLAHEDGSTMGMSR